MTSSHTMITSQPAFPNDELSTWPGLTKREYFIAAAMKGLCANSIPGSHNIPKNIARTAVEVADATLALLTDEKQTP